MRGPGSAAAVVAGEPPPLGPPEKGSDKPTLDESEGARAVRVRCEEREQGVGDEESGRLTFSLPPPACTHVPPQRFARLAMESGASMVPVFVFHDAPLPGVRHPFAHGGDTRLRTGATLVCTLNAPKCSSGLQPEPSHTRVLSRSIMEQADVSFTV